METYTMSDLEGFLYGRVINVKDRFGFVKLNKKLPEPYNQRKEIYFSDDMINIGEVSKDKWVVLKLNIKNTEKPAASKISIFDSDTDLETLEPFYIRPKCGHISSSSDEATSDICLNKCRRLMQCGHYDEDFCFVRCPDTCPDCSDIQCIAEGMFFVPSSEVHMGAVSYVGEGHCYIKPYTKSLQENQVKGGGVYFAFDEAQSEEIFTGQRVVFTEKQGRNGKLDASKMAIIIKNSGDQEIQEITGAVKTLRLRQSIVPTVFSFTSTINPVDKLEVEAEIGTSDEMLKYTLKPKRQMTNDDPMDLNFCIAESYFLRLTQKAGKQYGIVSVTYYINPPLVRRFRAKLCNFETLYGKETPQSKHVLAFHGTDESNIMSIVKENFKTDLCQRNLYGKGIYLSEFPHIGLEFGKSLLLCKVLLGKSRDVRHRRPDHPLAAGYDSYRVKADDDGYGWALVVDNPDQILPCYIINYTT